MKCISRVRFILNQHPKIGMSSCLVMLLLTLGVETVRFVELQFRFWYHIQVTFQAFEYWMRWILPDYPSSCRIATLRSSLRLTTTRLRSFVMKVCCHPAILRLMNSFTSASHVGYFCSFVWMVKSPWRFVVTIANWVHSRHWFSFLVIAMCLILCARANYPSSWLIVLVISSLGRGRRSLLLPPPPLRLNLTTLQLPCSSSITIGRPGYFFTYA